MHIECSICFEALDELGALIFSPPDKHGKCAKLHACAACYDRDILPLVMWLKDPMPEHIAPPKIDPSQPLVLSGILANRPKPA